MTRRPAVRLAALVLLSAAAASLLAACGSSDDSVQAPTRDETSATTAATASGTPGAAPTEPSSAKTVNVYFARGEKIGTAHRRIASTPAVGRAAMEELLAGPTDSERQAGLGTEIPAGTTLLDLDIANGVATVDLSGTYDDGGGSLTMFVRLAQVVYTLTQFPTVERVELRIDGSPVATFSAEGIVLDDPMTRGDFRDVTPLVLLESVAPGDVVSSPVTVAGEANTFEATVRIRIVGADGSVLADTFTTATAGNGMWGTFSEAVPFSKGTNSAGTVMVFWDSPRDGSPQDVTEVPVRFA